MKMKKQNIFENIHFNHNIDTNRFKIELFKGKVFVTKGFFKLIIIDKRGGKKFF